MLRLAIIEKGSKIEAYVESIKWTKTGLLCLLSEHNYKKEILKQNIIKSDYDVMILYESILYGSVDNVDIVNTLTVYKRYYEDLVIVCPRLTFNYVNRDVKGAFLRGEEILATHPEYAYRYAVYVTRERFKVGENIIKGSDYQQYYERYFGVTL